MRVNHTFRKVIECCAGAPRSNDAGTWLVPEMIQAYCRLHQLGYAHSVESWHQGSMVGGLYGIALGRIFYGESMFTHKTDASKVALVHLVRILRTLQFKFIDCQVTTRHLKSLGAREIPRQEFVTCLGAACEGEDLGPSADRFAAAHLMQVGANP